MKLFPRSHSPDKSDSRDKINECREKIRSLVKYRSNDEHGSDVDQNIGDDNFRVLKRGNNVSAIVCSLDKFTDSSVTIMNCVFGEGGYVEPHTHRSHERVFVADGELYYEQENRTYRKGEVIQIPSGKIHSFKSDHALLTITWRPAFEKVDGKSWAPSHNVLSGQAV